MHFGEILGFNVDSAQMTVIMAVLCGLVAWCSCACRKRRFSRTNFAGAALNGATLVPFTIIASTPFSEVARAAAMSAPENLALAGMVGLLHITPEILLPKHPLKSEPAE